MTPFRRSELTDRLVRYLKDTDMKVLVTYEELSKITNSEITSSSANLTSARKILTRDHAQIWDAVRPRVGIVRLDHTQMAERLRLWHVDGIRRKAHRGTTEADIVELNELDIDTQARFRTSSVICECVAAIAAKKTQRKWDKVSRGTSNDLPPINATEWAISLTARPPTR